MGTNKNTLLRIGRLVGLAAGLLVIGLAGQSLTGAATGGGCGEAPSESGSESGDWAQETSAVRSESISVTDAESDCNSGGFEQGISHGVTFCKGEDWALPDTVARSEKGRLIVSLAPLIKDDTDDDGFSAVYNSQDWHGYHFNAYWSKLEGDEHTVRCDDGTYSCAFQEEPSIADYLDIDDAPGFPVLTTDVERIANDVHYSIYKVEEIPCVQQCEATATSTVDCSEDYAKDGTSDWNPDWGKVLNWYMMKKSNQGEGDCRWNADFSPPGSFSPSTIFEINATSSGHNGSGSPNWLGKLGVPTIFEAFDEWCRKSETDCDIDKVVEAASEAGLCDGGDCECDGSSDCFCKSDDCSNYTAIYSNFSDLDADMYADPGINSWFSSYHINKFLQGRREYASLTPDANQDGNVYSFFDEDYMRYRCRYHQRLLAMLNMYNENYRTAFTMYLNSESGNMGALPNTILSYDEIDTWAAQIIGDAVAISTGIAERGVLEACGFSDDDDDEDADDLVVSNLKEYLTDDPYGIWSVNLNAGGRAFKDLSRLAIAKGMGIATHGETNAISHAFLQHAFPFVQYDQENLTYKSCLNSLNCESFVPDSSDSIRSASAPPFDEASWASVQDGKLPFNHMHIDMTQIHLDKNTVSQYRKFRMSVLGALALGYNQIRLVNTEIPGQGNHQNALDSAGNRVCELAELRAAMAADESGEALAEYCADLQANGGASSDYSSGDDCNVSWPCIEHFQPYSLMQWVSKNIGTTVTGSKTPPPEAYCALFSAGTKYDGDFYDRVEELWNDNNWGQLYSYPSSETENEKDGKTYFTSAYNGKAAEVLGRDNDEEAMRVPYVHSMGRFCTLDVSDGGGSRARGFKDTYGEGSPSWDNYPAYGAHEAQSTHAGLRTVTGATSPRRLRSKALRFRISDEFADIYPGGSYTVKVVFAARDSSGSERGKWGLYYHNGDQWTLAKAVSFDESVLGDDLFTASFLLDSVDFSDRGPKGADLAIRHLGGAHADFLLIRVIPR